MTARPVLLASVALPLLALAGCDKLLGIQDLGAPPDDASTDSAESTASVRFILAAPDVVGLNPDNGLNIHLVGRPLLAWVQYGGSTAYVDVPVTATGVELRSTTDSSLYATISGLDLHAGETATVVIAGLVTSTSEADQARIVTIDEATVPTSTSDVGVTIVNAIADDTDALRFYLGTSSLGGVDVLSPTAAPFGTVAGTFRSAMTRRLRVGPQINTSDWGGEVETFTIAPQPPSTRLVAVVGGKVHLAASQDDPAASLILAPLGGASTVARADAAYYLINAVVDASASPLSATDLDTGELPLDVTSTPPLFYLTPDTVPHRIEIDIATLGVGHTITMPAPRPGQRTLVILNGLNAPGAGEPALGDYGISLLDEDTTGGSNVEVVDAMPAPSPCELWMTPSTGVPEQVGPLSFGGVGSRLTSPDSILYSIRLPNGTADLKAFSVDVQPRREVIILSGTENAAAGRDSIRMTPVFMNTWPWRTGAVAIGQ